MKKRVLLCIIGVLLVIGVGITFAYFTSGVEVSGDGATVELDPGDMIKVSYDAGGNSLSSNNLIPGQTLTKTFTVTVTPTAKENTASYSIYFDLTNNTFVKCDDSNYNSITNACIKDYEELTYTFKNQEGEILSSDNLIGAAGRILLASETKTVEVETTYEYTMEIEFHETNADQNHNMSKIIEGNINVEFGMMGSEYILSHYDTVLTRTDFSTTVTETTTGTIYKSLDESQYDNDGEVYYFAGNPTDNWFQFGTDSSGQPLYWRIIRINGNDSIRLIYNGINKEQTERNTMIATYSAFNGTYNDSNNNMYVGYMYANGDAHGLETSSKIKNTIDNWYLNNLIDEEEYLAGNAEFCGDRSLFSGNGIGTNETYYGAYNRLYKNKMPSLICADDNDLYTMSGSGYGNEKLTYPIGLITADEVAYAGGVYNQTNINYYLYNSYNYWTITPSYFKNKNAVGCIVDSSGLFNAGTDVYISLGVRPVINLKANVSLTGSGTVDDPFKLSVE